MSYIKIVGGKKQSPIGATLYPSAGAEIDTSKTRVAGIASNNNIRFAQDAYTHYPHMDVKIVGTFSPALWLRAFVALKAKSYI